MGLEVEASKGAATPIAPEALRAQDDGQELSAEDKKDLQAVVGCLIHIRDSFGLAQFAIHHVSRELQKPTSSTVMKIKRLIVTGQEISVRASLWTVVVRYCGCVVHLSTKQQSFVAQSSAEAELSGCHRAAVMALSVLNFIMEMWNESVRAEVFTDSKAGLAVTQRSGVGGIRHLQAHRVLDHFVAPLGIEVPDEVKKKGLRGSQRIAGAESLLGLLASCMMQVARATTLDGESDHELRFHVMLALMCLLVTWCGMKLLGIISQHSVVEQKQVRASMKDAGIQLRIPCGGIVYKSKSPLQVMVNASTGQIAEQF
eukprot:1387340-Amphidinium_carterae.6